MKRSARRRDGDDDDDDDDDDDGGGGGDEVMEVEAGAGAGAGAAPPGRKARPPADFVRSQYGASPGMTDPRLPSARDALMRGARALAAASRQAKGAGVGAPAPAPAAASSSSSSSSSGAGAPLAPMPACPSCLQPGGLAVATCSWCGRAACRGCVRSCDGCQRVFCYMCATADYSLADRDRVMCVACHPTTRSDAR